MSTAHTQTVSLHSENNRNTENVNFKTLFNLSILIILFMGCRGDKTHSELTYEENFPLNYSGTIIEKRQLRGPVIEVDIRSEKGRISTIAIVNEHKVLDAIKKGDYIQKKEDYSNRCLVVRNDSAFLFECVELGYLSSLPKIDSLKVGIKRWGKGEANQWYDKNDSIVLSQLD